jgi:hypothetical protein
MLKPYESIDWESRANSEGFSSVKSMVIHYIQKNNNFIGAILDLGISKPTFHKLKKDLKLNQFKAKDFYAWTKGYAKMDLLINKKMNEGLSAAEITEFIDNYLCIESVKNTMRRINAKKNLNYTSGNKGHPPRLDHK